MLELDGLVRRFGSTTALDGLSFQVPSGQVVGFLGPNGAGKSTAMRAILQLTALDAGEVRWNDHRYGFPMCQQIGYMPEERGLYPTMRVADQIAYLARLHGLSARDARRSTDAWLERLGVRDRAQDKVEALSLGNQQRVQLAAALVHGPALLVLDEPFSGLDPVGVDDLAAVLSEQAAGGATVLFSSHQLDLVEHLCEAVTIINHGRSVASGPVRDLIRGDRQLLVVGVEGDPAGEWARNMSGFTITASEHGRQRLALDPETDPQEVLAAAMAAGSVEHFAFESRRLSEVFREAVEEGTAA